MAVTDGLISEADPVGAFTGKRVLITGGLGFIGSNLARWLVGFGAKVLVIDSLVPECGGSLFNISDIESRVEVNITDVCNEHNARDAVRDQDYVFNLAGKSSHLDSMRDPYGDLETNCRAQLFVLEACRKYNPGVKVVHTSTRQIYGVPDYLPVDERHVVHPIDVNGVHKFAGEWYHIVYSRVYGVRACVLRLTNTYGPRMRVKDARQTFLGWWIRQLIEGHEIQIFGDGGQLRDFSFIDDVVDALLLVALADSCDGEVYNLGGDGPISLRELAELLISLNGGGNFSIVPFPPEQKAIDIGDYYADDRKFRSHFGRRPRTPLANGLKRTLEYYREHWGHYWGQE